MRIGDIQLLRYPHPPCLHLFNFCSPLPPLKRSKLKFSSSLIIKKTNKQSKKM